MHAREEDERESFLWETEEGEGESRRFLAKEKMSRKEEKGVLLV